MSLSILQKNEIKDHLISKIRVKLETYSPETSSMPFHYRLLGKDRMALFSFIHSVNTMLGQSIFEKVGELIAKPLVIEAVGQYRNLNGYISSQSILVIDSIMRELGTVSRRPNKDRETQKIKRASTEGDMGERQNRRVDLFIKSHDGLEYYYELKTAKPNINEFKGIKRQLLEWIAMRASEDPDVDIKTIVAIPYNPYEPEPYERWTLRGLFDLGKEVLVGKEFWDFVGGERTYEELLNIFEESGLELYDEIDEKMRSFARRN